MSSYPVQPVKLGIGRKRSYSKGFREVVWGLGVFGVLGSLIKIVITWEPWSVTSEWTSVTFSEMNWNWGWVKLPTYSALMCSVNLPSVQFNFYSPECSEGCDPLSSATLQKSGHFFNVIYSWLSFGSDDKSLCKSSPLWEWYSKIYNFFSRYSFNQPRNRRMICL